MNEELPPRDSDWQGEKYVKMDTKYTAVIEKERHRNPRDISGNPVDACRSTASCIWQTINARRDNNLPVGIGRLDPEGILVYLKAKGIDAVGFDDRPALLEAIGKEHPGKYEMFLWDPSDQDILCRNAAETYSAIFSNGLFQNVRTIEEMEKIFQVLAWWIAKGGTIGIMGKVALNSGENWEKYKSAQILTENELFVIANLDDSRPADLIPGCEKKVRTFTLPRVEAIVALAEKNGLVSEKCVLFESGSGFRYAFVLLRKTTQI